MSYVNVERFGPSDKYNEAGDHFRLSIDGQWYSAYLTPDAYVEPGEHEVEFKTSPKTGKVYVVSIDGRFRKPPGGGQRGAPPRSQAIPGSLPARPAPAAPAAVPAETKPGAKDMWIMATSIMQAMIAQGGVGHANLVDLAREAANAARAAARVFDGAPLDAVRAAVRPAPVPQADPEDPRQAGPDFDDDIPF